MKAKCLCGDVSLEVEHFLPNDSYFVFAGLFADNADFKLEEQIFIDAKAPYYELANDTPKLTEEEFLAQFGDG